MYAFSLIITYIRVVFFSWDLNCRKSIRRRSTRRIRKIKKRKKEKRKRIKKQAKTNVRKGRRKKRNIKIGKTKIGIRKRAELQRTKKLLVFCRETGKKKNL